MIIEQTKVHLADISHQCGEGYSQEAEALFGEANPGV